MVGILGRLGDRGGSCQEKKPGVFQIVTVCCLGKNFRWHRVSRKKKLFGQWQLGEVVAYGEEGHESLFHQFSAKGGKGVVLIAAEAVFAEQRDEGFFCARMIEVIRKFLSLFQGDVFFWLANEHPDEISQGVQLVITDGMNEAKLVLYPEGIVGQIYRSRGIDCSRTYFR
ncbi:MAG: hypothetical protein MJ202_08860 [Lentisphaeria bacterium]|nr:hypothetical protein [Lentisphaeria bacterium]